MATHTEKRLNSPYLRLQADRCQRLSRNCMDLVTARDLRIMAEEYFAEASEIEVACLSGEIVGRVAGKRTPE